MDYKTIEDLGDVTGLDDSELTAKVEAAIALLQQWQLATSESSLPSAELEALAQDGFSLSVFFDNLSDTIENAAIAVNDRLYSER